MSMDRGRCKECGEHTFINDEGVCFKCYYHGDVSLEEDDEEGLPVQIPDRIGE